MGTARRAPTIKLLIINKLNKCRVGTAHQIFEQARVARLISEFRRALELQSKGYFCSRRRKHTPARAGRLCHLFDGDLVSGIGLVFFPIKMADGEQSRWGRRPA